MRPREVALAALTLASALVLTACGAFDASKAGGGAAPLTVRLASTEPLGRASSDEVETFAREIEARSEGSIRVEIVWEAHLGDDADNHLAENSYDGDPAAEVARQVQEGEVEFALVPDFAWISRGADSVRALKVPFLIDSVDLMREISRQEGFGALADLESLDVTPLALLPETIRHPVGFDHPMSSIPDFSGQGIRVVDSAAFPLIEAWGGRPMTLAGSFGAEVMAGDVAGADSAYAHAMLLPLTGVFTADVSYLAKFNTLVASSPWWSGLSAGQRGIVADAAAATLDHSIATTPDDDEEGREYCERGGTVVHAGAAHLGQLTRAAEPIIAGLRGDPDVREIVLEIDDLKGDLPPATVAAACAPSPPPEPEGDAGETAQFPEGSFRAEVTVEDFTERGVDLDTARNHAEVWTLTFRDGQVWDIGCRGTTYSVIDGRVSIVLGRTDPGCGSIPGGELFSARWSYDGSVLRFTDIGPGVSGPSAQTFSEVLWGSQDWIRID